MLRTDRCLSPELLVTEGVDHTEQSVVLRVRSLGTPRCSNLVGTSSLLSQHLSSPFAGSPWQGQHVQMQLKTRRSRCRNRYYQRKIFAERPPGVAAPQARETNRLAHTLRQVGYLLGGLPGSGLLGHLANGRQPRYGLTQGEGDGTTSKGAKGARPRRRRLVQGKQQRYGTMLMDL